MEVFLKFVEAYDIQVKKEMLLGRNRICIIDDDQMVINIINSWLLQVLPIFLLRQFFGGGEQVVWWIITLANVVCAFLFYAYYLRGRWLTVKV